MFQWVWKYIHQEWPKQNHQGLQCLCHDFRSDCFWLQETAKYLRILEGGRILSSCCRFSKKLVQWVACEEVQAYLEEDLEFFGALEHNVEKELPAKMMKKLKTHFTYLKKEYEKPTSFQLTLLQPYLSYLQLTVNNNTQMAISMAFVILERMTNPCFQDTEFATVMKG